MGANGVVTNGAPAPSARPDAPAFVRMWNWLMTGSRWRIPVASGALLAVALCLIVAGQAGYPLDDSWIHQDFARTLATTHQFAFAPGRSGAGSTSPIWVLLLTPPYLLFGATPPLGVVVGWSALLGAASLAGLAVLVGIAAGDLAASTSTDQRGQRVGGLLAGLATVTEWHLVWAAASGMETVLFCALVMAILLLAARPTPPWALGALCALAVAVRPEGAALVALVSGAALWPVYRGQVGQRRGARLRGWAAYWAAPFGGTFLLGIAPYLLLNQHASGHLLPSTISAKAAYYSGGNPATALFSYLAQVAVLLLASSVVLLLLGVLSYSHWIQARRLHHASNARSVPRARHGATTEHGGGPARALRWLLVAWPLALLVAYAGRLPLLYHNGRYLMPSLAPLIALAAAGALPLLEQRRLIARVAVGLLAAAGLFTLARGAQIYSANVRFVNSTQVDTARWLSAHTAPRALIATHDIGAIGYFAGRPLVDIAGLVDPGIIPYLNDQPRLEAYLRARRVGYVAEFTDWFGPPNTLARDLARGKVYQAHGSANFVVLRTDW